MKYVISVLNTFKDLLEFTKDVLQDQTTRERLIKYLSKFSGRFCMQISFWKQFRCRIFLSFVDDCL